MTRRKVLCKCRRLYAAIHRHQAVDWIATDAGDRAALLRHNTARSDRPAGKSVYFCAFCATMAAQATTGDMAKLQAVQSTSERQHFEVFGELVSKFDELMDRLPTSADQLALGTMVTSHSAARVRQLVLAQGKMPAA